MFNWPLKFRKQTDFISPVGPNFNSAPWKTFDISGTQVKIKAPPLRTTLPVTGLEVRHPCDLHHLDDKLTERNGIRLRLYPLIYRWWDFYGSWFTGRRGCVQMQAMIVSPAEIPESLNYYHPRAFEAGIADYLSHLYDNDFWSDGSQTWLAPLNWHSRNNSPYPAVRFEANKTRSSAEGPNFYLAMPVSKHHLLIIDCDISRSNVFSDKKPKPALDEWIDIAPFVELANQVLDSVQVTLSPQAQAEQEEALRGLEDKSLTAEFLPIKWAAKPQNN